MGLDLPQETGTNLVTGIDGQIAKVNARLKAGKLRVSIERRGDWLWLRGTFPPKPHLAEKHAGPYRQKFALDLPANPAGLQQAERRAKHIAGELIAGKFEWEDHRPTVANGPQTVTEWLHRFEQQYWQRRKRDTSSENNWRGVYLQVFRKLPPDAELTLELMISLIEATEADSRIRQRCCMVLSQLAELAGMSSAPIQVLSGNYSPDSVNPRKLPNDKVIAECRETIKHPGWKWIYGICAAYGLRNHEVFHVDLEDFPTIWVNDTETKTGRRFVYPLFPEWAESWGLETRSLPNLDCLFDDEFNYTKAGTKVSRWFYKSSIPFTCYDLRHSYARRAFEFGFSPDLGAKLMGHSVSTHTRIYRAWIDELTYRRAYDIHVSNPNRPQAPGASGTLPESPAHLEQQSD